MEQAVIFATDRQVSSSCAFQLKPPDAELDTMRIGEIELNPIRRTVKKSGYRGRPRSFNDDDSWL